MAQEIPQDSRPPTEAFAKAILAVTFVDAAIRASTLVDLGLDQWASLFTAFGITAFLVSAILAYFDARALAAWSAQYPTDAKRPPMVPWQIAICYLLLWAVMLPIHFWRRKFYGARNYLWPAIVGVVLVCAATAAQFLMPARLPAAGAPEIVQLVQKTVADSLLQQPDPSRFGPPTITNPIERSFDRERQIRDVKCTLTTKLGPEDFYYTIEWHDRSKRLFQVRTRATP